MNKTKRNLILSSAIINIINMIFNFVVVIICIVNPELIAQSEFLTLYLYSFIYYTAYFAIVECVVGLIGSVCLIWSVRKSGKYFRRSQGYYIAGLIVVILAGGWIPWILLLISMFIPDIIVMNMPNEVRREERIMEREEEVKKKKIEELRKLKDDGVISEEEFNQKLMELL